MTHDFQRRSPSAFPVWRLSRLLPALAVLVSVAPAMANPISLHCTIKGPSAKMFGRLTVEVDLDALSVAIEAPEKMPGIRWEYRNGQVAPILTRTPLAMLQDTDQPMTMPTLQFVRLTDQFVIMGWRTPDGEPGGVSSFNRSALASRPAPCIWHRAAEFDRA